MRSRLKKVWLILLMVIVSTTTAYPLHWLLPYVEGYSLKYRLISRSEKIENKNIVIVLITDETLRDRPSKSLKRSDYARVIEAILKGKPKVIGVDIFFDGIKDLADDLKLAAVLDRSDVDVVLAVYPDETKNLVLNRISSLAPRHSYKFKHVVTGNIQTLVSVRTVGVINSQVFPVTDSNGEELSPFSLLIASKYRGASFEWRRMPYGQVSLALNGVSIPSPLYIDYIGGLEAFSVVPFEKILETDGAMFKDRIVLIGTSDSLSEDFHPTPMGDNTPGVIILANIIHSLLANRYVTPLFGIYQLGLNGIASLLVLMTLGRRPFVTLLTSMGLLVLAKLFVDLLILRYAIDVLAGPMFFTILLSLLAVFLLRAIEKRRLKNRTLPHPSKPKFLT